MKSGQIYQALILNDYEHAAYATNVKLGLKTMETRMNRLFKYRGDIWKGRDMLKTDEDAACIGWHPKRKVLLLRNWRWFSEDFEFSKQKVSGAFQSIFQITIPTGIKIIPRPEIIPYPEPEILTLKI